MACHHLTGQGSVLILSFITVDTICLGNNVIDRVSAAFTKINLRLFKTLLIPHKILFITVSVTPAKYEGMMKNH